MADDKVSNRPVRMPKRGGYQGGPATDLGPPPKTPSGSADQPRKKKK